MFKTRPVLSFLIKAILIYTLLVLPISFIDSVYGKFYQATFKTLFSSFHKNGFAKISETRRHENTHIEVGNITQAHADGTVPTVASDFNKRYRGYIPTAFLIALILASPISVKRKLLSLFTGIFLMTAVIMFKQWIHILYMCKQGKSLMLYDFSKTQEKMIDFFYTNFANYNGPTLFLAIAIWLLVCFRKKDIEVLYA